MARQLSSALKALEGFPALMVVELGFTSEMGAALDRGDPALVDTLHDPVALVFGHGTEEGDKAAAEGRGEVQVRPVEHLMFVYLSSRCM